MFSVISRPSWEVRLPSRAPADRERKERTHAEPRRRGGLGGGGFCTKGQKGNKRVGWSAGGRPTLKTMKTASRTWKSGRKAAVQSGHGRPARGAESGRENGDYRREPRRETQSCVAWNSRIRARTATPFPSILFMSPSCPPAVRKRFPPLGTHLPATRSGATRLSMKKNVDKTVVRD